MEKLAVHGGDPVRKELFPAYDVIGAEEKKAVNAVLDSGVLSRFLGCWDDLFYGGPEIRAFEAEWAKFFNVKHAIALNSCTSGLYCAIGAAGIGPGDEVIVSPYTMSASATSILVFNGVPVFADIEDKYFCLDPKSVEERITPRTKAIVVVDIFGLPYDVERINAIAKKHNLLVIEDCAQAPAAQYKGRWAGTLGDIGVFSLNYHKHIHTGEGGVVVTENDELADRIRLIRNHAEAVVGDKGTKNIVNMVGFNFRMTEIEAAIGRCQLRKLKDFVRQRIDNVNYLNEKLSSLPGITAADVREGCVHAYYDAPFHYDEKVIGVSRNRFLEAVTAELKPMVSHEAEGVSLSSGYVKPLYLQPMYQQQIGYGDKGCPFRCPLYGGKANYSKGICPTTERLHEKELFVTGLIHASMTHKDLDDVYQAFAKVYANRKDL